MSQTLSAVVPYGDDTPVADVQRQGSGGQRGAGLKAIVPAAAWDQRNDAAMSSMELGGEKLQSWRLWIEGTLLVMLAIADNALSYVTYATVPAFHNNLYTIADMQLVLLPGLDIALLILAGLGTASFGLMVVLVECNKLPLFHEIMNFRLYFSALPCGAICAIILYFTEQTRWAPFATLMAISLMVISWCLHMRVHYSNQMHVVSKIGLDVSWFLSLICGTVLLVLYTTDSVKIISKSNMLNCPYADNAMMPVHVRTLDQWYCAPWDLNTTTEISRTPVNSDSVQLSCTDSFVTMFGVSIEPHKVHCPVGCLRTFQGSSVVGCGIYTVDSSVCVSAIHAGVLTDQGGEAIVYGRVGVPHFQRCSQNSIVSTERGVMQIDEVVSVSQSTSGSLTSSGSGAGAARRLVTSPFVQGLDGVQIPPAFHFNNMDHTREFIWLKRWEKVSSREAGVQANKPWTRIKAVVSMRMAGIELEEERVRLGEYPQQPLFTEAQPGQESVAGECRVHERGVLCQGGGAALAQLDFCRPQVKTCPR
mmetsp:Transcript_7976/g.18989  ORF Transcript_7976/g.18989 Transcript_7976/m.18989 type:complete len:533 (-) Transcript_7976:72-1670(-)